MIKNYAKIDPDTNQVLTSVRVEGNNDLEMRTKLEKITGWSKDNWVVYPDDEEEATLQVKVGSTYNSGTGKFLRPKPYSSWTLKSDGTDWEAPVTKPAGRDEIHWDEANQEWRDA